MNADHLTRDLNVLNIGSGASQLLEQRDVAFAAEGTPGFDGASTVLCFSTN